MEKLQQLKKAQVIIKRIEEIDSLLLTMGKMANVIAIDPHELSISINLKDLSEKSKPKDSVLDEDGSLKIDNADKHMWSLYSQFTGAKIHQKLEDTLKFTHSINFNLRDNEAFKIFDYAYNCLTKEREVLLNKIENL